MDVSALTLEMRRDRRRASRVRLALTVDTVRPGGRARMTLRLAGLTGQARRLAGDLAEAAQPREPEPGEEGDALCGVRSLVLSAARSADGRALILHVWAEAGRALRPVLSERVAEWRDVESASWRLAGPVLLEAFRGGHARRGA